MAGRRKLAGWLALGWLGAAAAAAAAPIELGDGAKIPATPWRVQSAGRPYSFSVDGDVFRFEIKEGDHRRREETVRRRSQITGLTAPSTGRVDLAFDLLVEPAPFLEGRYILAQLQKGAEDPGDVTGEHPIASFQLVAGGRPSLSVSGSDQKPLRLLPRSETVWTGQAADLPLGTWHHVRIILVQGGASPSAELWIDGSRKVRHLGKVGYPNLAPPYVKLGLEETGGQLQDTVALFRAVTMAPWPEPSSSLNGKTAGRTALALP